MFYQTVTETIFKDSFEALRPDNFSHGGLFALYCHLDELSQHGPIELDVVAICCDFSEEPLQDVLDNYGLESLEQLEEETDVITHLENGNVVYRVF